MIRPEALLGLVLTACFSGFLMRGDTADAGLIPAKYDVLYNRSGDIWIMSQDGTNQRMLIAQGSHPVLSLDRDKIAFVAEDGGDSEIMVVNADGTGLANVSNHPAGDDIEPAWAPDGSHVIYSRDGEIYRTNVDGTGVVNPTNAPGTDRQPAYSQEGTQVAFRSNRDGNDEIYVMGPDGGGQTNISNHAGNDEHPAWSVLADRIAWESNRSGNPDIWVMEADGDNPQQLTNDAGNDREPAWAPGVRLLWTSLRSGAPEVWVMEVNGSNETQLTFDNDDSTDPSWTQLFAGDANCVGAIDAIDAALILQWNAGLLTHLACALDADVNQDGDVNAIDAALVLQFAAGLLNALPP
jgi:Tol biopolymer transport system component